MVTTNFKFNSMKMTEYKFDTSGFNYIDIEVQKGIRKTLSKDFPEFEEILEKVKDAHLFLHVKNKEIYLDLGVYGRQPLKRAGFTWIVKSGVRYITECDYTIEVDYFGGDTYYHDDFYRVKDEPIELE